MLLCAGLKPLHAREGCGTIPLVLGESSMRILELCCRVPGSVIVCSDGLLESKRL